MWLSRLQRVKYNLVSFVVQWYDMVRTEQYKQTEWSVPINSVEEIPLIEHLGERAEAFRSKMRDPDTKAAADWSEDDKERYKTERLARKVLVVHYSVGTMARSEWLTIPMASGYSKSNLKKVLDKNPGLPPDTNDWQGNEILVALDSGGYYELAK